MILQNEICHIEINIDETYTVDSVDNRHYDVRNCRKIKCTI